VLWSGVWNTSTSFFSSEISIKGEITFDVFGCKVYPVWGLCAGARKPIKRVAAYPDHFCNVLF
jgi:hypothetical protein